jgi:hypothetical protein
VLRGDNELWLGLALMSGHLDALEPADLAAVLEAISTEVNRPDLWCGFPPPPAAEEALHDLRAIRRQLERQQEQGRVVVPVWWEPELTGLVAHWARGASWNEVIGSTSLDEGDVVRVLRRTVDLLAQIPYAEAISDQLRRNARRALRAINRFPVCEVEDLLTGSGSAATEDKPNGQQQPTGADDGIDRVGIGGPEQGEGETSHGVTSGEADGAAGPGRSDGAGLFEGSGPLEGTGPMGSVTEEGVGEASPSS